jgi:SpoIIAA-like
VLERLHDLPESVVGIEASGEVTAEDYKDVLIPAVEGALEGGRKVRLLYLLGDDVHGVGFTAGASWQDTKVGLGHYNRWEKAAVVSDSDWLRHSVSVLGYLMPGEVKAFTRAEEAAARTWIAG